MGGGGEGFGLSTGVSWAQANAWHMDFAEFQNVAKQCLHIWQESLPVQVSVCFQQKTKACMLTEENNSEENGRNNMWHFVIAALLLPKEHHSAAAL